MEANLTFLFDVYGVKLWVTLNILFPIRTDVFVRVGILVTEHFEARVYHPFSCC